MTANTFFHNPNFITYVRLLGELHRLIQQGCDEGPQGDELRDRMDTPGERLSREELTAVKGIAADFYSLMQTRDIFSADAARADNLVRAVSRECESRRFAAALELARGCEGLLPPTRLAEVRATIWQAANEPRIAQMFLDGAARLQRQPLPVKTES